jgi:hypothetical protein
VAPLHASRAVRGNGRGVRLVDAYARGISVQHEGGSIEAVNNELRACLQKAQADLDRELASARAGSRAQTGQYGLPYGGCSGEGSPCGVWLRGARWATDGVPAVDARERRVVTAGSRSWEPLCLLIQSTTTASKGRVRSWRATSPR